MGSPDLEMGRIQTVLGSISPDELGITYSHDHLLWCPPPPYAAQDPDLRLDSIDVAVQELSTFKAAGGQAFVEMSTPDVNRDPEGLREISKKSGVHVIAVTGHHKDKFSRHMVSDQTVSELVDTMVGDLTEGMDDTDICAGVLKAATSENCMTDTEQKVFEAVAEAHLATGAPVSTHTDAGTYALEQIEALREGGVDPSHIVIGHLDRNLDWELHSAIADTGVFMGFDQISKEKYAPDIERINFIRRLIETGHGDQILLSGDWARKSYWPSYGFGNGPGLTYILWRFVPWMLEEGISVENVEQIMIHNPARAFSWKG